MDVHTGEQRSRNMRAIKSKNTGPEIAVQKLVRGLGYRFSLNCKSLPGKPDLVFRSHRKVIFVHGCYWHMHRCRLGSVVEKTRTEFWQTKRKSNVVRDRLRTRQLRRDRWEVLVVWSCQLRDPARLARRLDIFLRD